jgi:peptidyl-prolyl cis-trans isomerase B (cyclophilin B)
VTIKREREYERRRYEKWQERQAKARARKTRQRWIVGSIVAAIILVISAAGLIVLNNDDGTPSASETSPATSETPAPSDNAAQVPDPSLAQDRTWTGQISLTQGDIGIELDGAAAPQAVANFVTLAGQGFFDKTKCHRLTTDGIYVLQCGDPEGTGMGGPGYSWGPIENAPADNVYPAGTIAMARQGGNAYSMGSQFFIVYGDTTIPADAAGGYTVIGTVTGGLDELNSQITSKGVEGGASDGKPAVPVTMSDLTVE